MLELPHKSTHDRHDDDHEAGDDDYDDDHDDGDNDHNCSNDCDADHDGHEHENHEHEDYEHDGHGGDAHQHDGDVDKDDDDADGGGDFDENGDSDGNVPMSFSSLSVSRSWLFWWMVAVAEQQLPKLLHGQDHGLNENPSLFPLKQEKQMKAGEESRWASCPSTLLALHLISRLLFFFLQLRRRGC